MSKLLLALFLFLSACQVSTSNTVSNELERTESKSIKSKNNQTSSFSAIVGDPKASPTPSPEASPSSAN